MSSNIAALYSVNNNVSFSSLEAKYFGANISDDQLERLMKLYNIQSSGDKEIDIKKLKDVMFNHFQTQAIEQTSETNQANQANKVAAQADVVVPWQSLMDQLSLPVSGELDVDYVAFNERIEELRSKATSPEEDTYIDGLVTQGQSVFINQESVNNTQYIAQTANASDIVATMNKAFLIGVK